MVKFILFCSLLFQIGNANHVSVDDFNNGLSKDWKGRSCNFEKIYVVASQNGSRYLSANSSNSDNFILKEIEVDLVKYPYLNWKWRVNNLPDSGDESKKEKCDVAASIAVVLNDSKICPKSIKYTWSSTLKKNSFTKSPYAVWPAKCDIFVVESGKESQNTWKTEKVNVLEHYKKLYGDEKVKSKIIKSIVIMTDSDNTTSLSAADYDDIYFSKN